MEINPYEAPRSVPGTPVLGLDNPLRLWRDKDQLVLRYGVARFPAYCLKTAEPYQGQATNVTLEWVPQAGFWTAMFGLIGYTLARLISGRKFSLALPVLDTWIAKGKRAAWIGWMIVGGGILVLILGTIGAIAGEALQVPEVLKMVLIAPIIAGPFVAIIGGIYLAVTNQPLLTLVKVKDDYLWLKGVHPNYLNQLPEWEVMT